VLSELLDEIEERLRLIIREEIRLALLDSKNLHSTIEYQINPEIEKPAVNKDIPRLLTASDVAETLGVSVQRVYELVRTRKTSNFPVIKIGERQYRFSKEAILAWIERDSS
jgi:excisionase family DNA binding protein